MVFNVVLVLEAFKVVASGIVGYVEICRSQLLMMCGGMMFGDVIGFVQNAFFPVDVELSLSHAVANPIKAHVDSFGAFLFDGIVCDAGGGAVVGLDGCGGLRMIHFFESGADGAGFFEIVE